MPPVVAGIAAAVSWAAGAVGVTIAATTATTIATGILVNGIIMGVEYGLSAVLKPHNSVTKDPGSNQVNVRQAISYRQSIYGEVRTGGVITYIGLSGNKNEYLHMVVTIAGHKVHALHQNNQIYINGDAFSLSGGAVGGKYSGFMWIETDLGDPNNSSQPFPQLASECPNWTSTCLQRGCAKVHIKLKWDQDIFANGVPTITFDVQGKEVFDPRTSTTVFSSNPALLLRDYLLSSEGMRVTASMVDDAACIAAANICDEQMALRQGGTQKRYTANGVLTSDMERGKIIQLLAGAMMGFVVPPGDQWRMFAGAYRNPVMDITDSMLRGPIKMDTRVSRRDLCNGIKGTYISSTNNWQPSDFPAYQSATYLAEDGNEPLWTDIAFDLETDPVRAQRRAKIVVEQARRKRPLSLPCKLRAFGLEPGDTIRFTHARWGLNSATYLVAQAGLTTDISEDAPTLGVDLTLYPIDANVYAWDANVDEGTVVPSNVLLLPDSSDVAPVTGMTLLSDETTTVFRADGIAHTQIKVTWTPPADQMVVSGGNIEVWVSPAGGTYRLDGRAAGSDSEYYISTNIIDGHQYWVRLVAVNASGAHSTAVEQNVTASSVHSIITGDDIVLTDGGTLNAVPQQVTINSVTESPYKTDSGQLRSLVAVSFTPAVGDLYFYKAKVFFTGYHGGSTYEYMTEGTQSPIQFLCDTTGEDVTVTVQAVRNNGNEADLTTAPTAIVTLDGADSAPPAPSIAQAQTALPGNIGWQFTFNTLKGLESDLIDGYWVYHTSTTSPPTNTNQRFKYYPQSSTNVGTISPQEVTQDILYYWVSAVNVAGYESTMTPVPFVYTDPGDPAPAVPAPVNLTKTYQPSTLLNGWTQNQQKGYYETSGSGAVSAQWGINNDPNLHAAKDTWAMDNPGNVFDGNDTTSSNGAGVSTHKYFGCVWSFSGVSMPTGATITAANVKILSEVFTVLNRPYHGCGSVWYSLDGGTTWTSVYTSMNSARIKQYDTITLTPSQNIANIRVMGFCDSHDDAGLAVHNISLEVSMSVSAGPEKVTGVSAKLV